MCVGVSVCDRQDHMRLMERATMLQSVNSELQEKNTALESRWGTILAGIRCRVWASKQEGVRVADLSSRTLFFVFVST